MINETQASAKTAKLRRLSCTCEKDNELIKLSTSQPFFPRHTSRLNWMKHRRRHFLTWQHVCTARHFSKETCCAYILCLTRIGENVKTSSHWGRFTSSWTLNLSQKRNFRSNHRYVALALLTIKRISMTTVHLYCKYKSIYASVNNVQLESLVKVFQHTFLTVSYT